MHFSQIEAGPGSRITKIAVVLTLHVAVALALVSIKVKPGEPIAAIPDVALIPEAAVVPPEPVEPPPVTERTPPPMPTVVMPRTEVDLPDPLPLPTITAKVVDTTPPPDKTLPGIQTVTPPKRTESAGGGLHTAVLVNAANCAKPDYPQRAARNGDAGTVALALLVDINGRVADSRIEKSSGSRDLDRAAANALSLCQFKPATQDGVPQQAWAKIAYVWTLEQ